MKFHQFPKNRFSKNPTKPYSFPRNATGSQITGTMKGNIYRLMHGFRRTSTPFPDPEDLAAWVMDLSLRMEPELGSDEKSLSDTWKMALAAATFALDNYDPEHPSILRGSTGGTTSKRPSLLMIKFRELVKIGALNGQSVPQQAEIIGCSDRSVQRLHKRHATEVETVSGNVDHWGDLEPSPEWYVDTTETVDDGVSTRTENDPWDLEFENVFHEANHAGLFTNLTPMEAQPLLTWVDTFDREKEDLKVAQAHVEEIMAGILLDAPESSPEAEDLAPVLWMDDYRKPTREPVDDGVLEAFEAALAESGGTPKWGWEGCQVR